ncbi:type II secretion system F family protein [Pseudobdellovibrio exovorus]|uniref:Type II secretion system protein GspF domain-containing protein n=1 Tax=Pseudobdellovibrio exovorus JSS TaxID=1184267 RepID=M4VDP1_9BACT|nr:type II secretion system F family protein [Pseudobdellovibrio exovorus]AGH96605.1 hypothetical protein A11Q_2389 [Pseudobdellovibrio exovorus JSS]
MTLRELSHFYNNISLSLHAGISLISFFENLRATTKDSSQKSKISLILTQLRKGTTLHESLQLSGFVPLFDLPVLEAAERSGSMVSITKLLSARYDLSATTDKDIRSGLYLPFLLTSAAIFLPEFPRVFLGELTMKAYFIKNMAIVAGLATVIYFIRDLFMRSYYDFALARFKHNLFKKIPFLNSLIMNVAKENFCTSLEIMLESGIPIFDALRLAANTSADPDIASASHRMVGELKAGKTIPQAFLTESIFGVDLQRAIITGWESGELPATLRQQAEMLRKDIGRSIAVLSKTVPMILYWISMLYAAGTIFNLHLGNMKTLMQML